MKAIIPLAGYGKRMRPLTHSRPKPLLNVAGKPMLGHVLDRLLPLNVEELVIIRGYLGDQIETYVSSHYPQFSVVHYVDQHELKGQAHALWLAQEHISGPIFSTFVDTIFETDLNIIQQTDADGLAFVKEVADPRRFGIAITDAKGRIRRLVEKPESTQHRLALIGAYFIRDGEALNAAVAELLLKRPSDERRILHGRRPANHDRQRRQIHHRPSRYLGRLRQARGIPQHQQPPSRPRRRLRRPRRRAQQRRPSRRLHRSGARVEDCVIGPDVSIASGAVLRHSNVRNSIIDEDAMIEHVHLEGSMIGQRAHVRHFIGRLHLGDDNVVRGD